MRPLGNKLAATPFALSAALAISFMSFEARAADEDDEPTSIEISFALGAAGLEEASIEAERFGATTVLSAGHPRGGSGSRLDLVCHLCSGEEVVAASRTLGALLRRDVDGIEPITLEIEGAASGDAIFVDGVRSSSGPGPRTIEAGPHDLTVVIDGRPRSGEFESDPGQAVVVVATDLEERRERTALRVGVVMTGLGAALAAAGTTMLVFDGGCAAPRVDDSGNCQTVHDLAPAGWSLLGAGAASLVSGIVAVIVSATRERRRDPRTEGKS